MSLSDQIACIEEDAVVIRTYLPSAGHPQDVEECECPYCALGRILAALDEATAEVESLKCCGSCKHHDAEEFQFCAHPETLEDNYHADDPYYLSAPGRCAFTPSRWEGRGT